MSTNQENCLVILGPTASGKTRVGVGLAFELGGEVISADSRQVYRELNIGSGKDLEEYIVQGTPVPYHLIDVANLTQEYSVFDFQQAFYTTFVALQNRHVLPVVVGGTGLYLEAALKQYRMVEVPENQPLRKSLKTENNQALIGRLQTLKPSLHNTTDLMDRERLIRAIEIAVYSQEHEPEPAPVIRPLILGMQWERATLRTRIFNRLTERIKAGMIEEVRDLHTQGVTWERLERLGLEYRFIAEYLEHKIKTKNELIQQLHIAIGQFAKRQETWFRRMERQGAVIHWIPQANFQKALALAHTHFQRTRRTS